MFFRTIRQKAAYKILFSLLLITLNGCVYMVVGGLGAAGGYYVSPDTVEGLITGNNFEEVWEAVIEVVSVRGVIEERDDRGGIMVARIGSAKTTITALRMSQNAVKLTIKARKYGFPRIKVAQDLYIKAVNYMENNG